MTDPNRPIAARQRGVSLVELMIAVVLALLLMAGVFSVYLSTKTTYRFQRGVSEIQENGRFANYFLTKEVRNAGYAGCPNLKSITPRMNVDFSTIGVTPAFTVSLDDAISGHELTGEIPAPGWTAPFLPASGTVLDDTDVFTIQFAAECGAVLTANMATDNANIQVIAPNTCNFQANDILLISDCIAADVFAATSVSSGTGQQTIAHSNAGNTTASLSKVYGPNAELLQLQSMTYFLANSNGQPSLWRRLNHRATGANNPEMLVSGVESMQLQYGVDTDNDRTVEQYQTANAVTDWGAVVTARIALLMRSADRVKPETDTGTYSLLGATIDPVDDQRFRKIFVSTISLRNRLP